MALRDLLQRLANQKSNPSVTISLNTHRSHPENQQDEIVLKNLVKEAAQRVEEEFGKREAAEVLEKLENIESKIDHNHNLESLHIFISKDEEEVVKTTWPVRENLAQVDETFAVRYLIKALNRSEEYLILRLAQDGTHLHRALNDSVIEEVQNHVFPFGENPNKIDFNIRKSDAEYVDSQIQEHYRTIDKALVNYLREQDEALNVVVLSTRDNYDHLMKVASQPQIYVGHDDKDYHARADHHIAAQAWEIIKQKQSEQRTEAIGEMKEAISKAQVLTDLQEIYQAAIDGRGELLIVHQDYEQPVKMIDDRSFQYAEDAKAPGVLDDIVSTIAWEVLSKKGRVHFTAQEEITDLGSIVLKTRY
ncbi:baeRF3 domain-containing protein [Bergeyella sp. RCAD1439]|uniref:baeRF3 domain-containing protein n=1 Tax=Bergeyella anatis TaxID=3113737 RepID=UPI002E17BD63|nr:hypothetical protein [Bergeyella sp. RCAD1439]